MCTKLLMKTLEAIQHTTGHTRPICFAC